MIGKFTQKAKVVVDTSQKLATTYGHSFVGTEHLLLSMIKVKDTLAYKVLQNSGANFEKIEEKMLEINPLTNEDKRQPRNFTPKTKKVLEMSFKESINLGSTFIGTEHILLALINETDSIGVKLLLESNIDILALQLKITSIFNNEKSVLTPILKKNTKIKSITPTLDKYGRDFTKMVTEEKFDPIVGREKEISRLIQILSRRTKNNPCLVGDPGVGKTAIIEGLSKKIADGNVPDILKSKKIVCLDLSSMVAGSKYRGEFENRIKKVMEEVIAHKNIILFIDELHTLIGAGGAEGALDTSNILKPALARGEIQVIGATTIDEYRKRIEKEQALERRFQQIVIEEPNEKEAIEMLNVLKEKYESHHDVVIKNEAIDLAVKLSIRYIGDRFLPDKAIDVLDEACSKIKLKIFEKTPKIENLEEKIETFDLEKLEAIKKEDYELAGKIKEEQNSLRKDLEKELKKWENKNKKIKKEVDGEIVAEIVSDWSGIPIQSLKKEENKKLINMEKTIHESVIGQEEAVTAVSKAIRRGRVGLKDPTKPSGSFLFLGPTGVGKTETAKALAKVLFGDENSLIRIDMSEYMEKHSVAKIIGSPPGYVGHEEGGQLSERVRRKPYSVLLFDEIEKAHPDIFNVLLQVLDDGHITDSSGRKIDFKNTVIIMTSNVGSKNIVEPKKLGFEVNQNDKKDYKNMKSNVMEEVKKTFKPEFLNRIDDIVVFHPLGEKEISKIAKLMVDELVTRAKENVNLDISYTDEVINLIAKKGYNKIYGARPLRREIQTLLEDYLSEQILLDEFISYDKINVSVKEEELVFNKV